MAEVNDWTTYLSEEEKGLLHRAESYTPSYFAQKVAALRVLVEASQKALRAIEWQPRAEGLEETAMGMEMRVVEFCPWCQISRTAGHGSDCIVASALALKEADMLERLEEKP